MEEIIQTREISVGVVGLGLMGSSIVAALLLAGHPVKAIAPLPTELADAPDRILSQIRHADEADLLAQAPDAYIAQLTVSADYGVLADCRLVLECVTEKIAIKQIVYQKIAAVVSSETVIASNTSAIPISMLQQLVPNPERFLGIHWAEPAYMTRFMEITCGTQTSLERANWAFELAHYWQKEPTLLRKDIRGFVTNRLMYAIYREGLHLVEKGDATLEDVDKAFRYDAGSWITMMGIFRRMDYTGLQDYPEIFRRIFPLLSNSDEVPDLMQQLVDRQLRGTQSAQGLYDYTEEEAKEWDKAFAVFNKDIYQLAARYPFRTDQRIG
ncbi:3-hydroxyacyl-CoA dehydrogenase family protein [Larkinella terrae]|uniref:3-hydroxyacyl-CoA dehydrogenase family protein n=1 Tax=Larkinella terrae TaxID=2025311 RepID=A0A7K0EG75_9BACT|nr:3-hydroxyacyl-CoA dehydrogenase family protein [Larkinella terrae]MRS60446.1 3-hydroxyacyl-CoA dehydrogenase family protein [Larkinella terrae]